jgi:hypothetical protein
MKPLLNLLSTAASFLTNQPPPGVDAAEAERLKSVNHLESKKFFIVISSVAILIFFLFAGTAILFFLPHMPEIITGYITLFSKTTEILAVVIAFYVSAQAVVDLKYGSSSSSAVSAQSQTTDATNTNTTNTTTTENINETLTVIHTNAKDEDYELE